LSESVVHRLARCAKDGAAHRLPRIAPGAAPVLQPLILPWGAVTKMIREEGGKDASKFPRKGAERVVGSAL